MTWSPRLRLVLACVFLSSWLFALLVGLAAGGLVHLLLLAALAIWPWRAPRPRDRS